MPNQPDSSTPEHPQPVTLENLTPEHFKALAYDQPIELQRIQTNIKLIQAESARHKLSIL